MQSTGLFLCSGVVWCVQKSKLCIVRLSYFRFKSTGRQRLSEEKKQVDCRDFKRSSRFIEKKEKYRKICRRIKLSEYQIK